MSLIKAAKKKETLADVHHDQTDNFYDDFVDLSPPEFEFLEGEETQTPAAPTYPAIFNESLISPSTCAGQNTSKMSLRETFQPTQPNSSVETSIRGKAASQTTMLQQQLLLRRLLRRRQQWRWVLQKRQQQWRRGWHLEQLQQWPKQRPYSRFPHKQPLQEPPRPQTWSPTGLATERRLETVELQNPEFKKTHQDPPPFPAEDRDIERVSQDQLNMDLVQQKFYLTRQLLRFGMMVAEILQEM
ncbi:uncharacterized protein LOC112145274 [Oryzias melastigma]|uniref:uncharacterized protein LOC112145274 n=1 Tax=Oryzias melastigma TaxID=30732 RepID=UPI000CF82768|nr:uncharacterized protein LOC112145274 [Oryzias melastigma]